MKKSLWLVSLLTLFVSAQKVYVASHPKVKPVGLLFCLPQNTIKGTIEIEEIRFTPGLLQTQMRKFFPYLNRNDSLQVFYIIKSFSYSIEALPDEKRCYYLSPSLRKETSVIISNNLLLAINDIPLDLTLPQTFYQEFFVHNFPISLGAYPILDHSLWTSDTITEKVFTDSTIIENIKVITKLTEKTIEEKGKEIAENIKKLLQHKIELNAGLGDVAFNDQTLKYMNHQLDSIINLYMSLFTGIYQRKTHHISFGLNPSRVGKTFLFGFSHKTGISFDSLVDGNRIYVSLQHKTNLQVNASEHITSKKLPGIPYVIPQHVELSLYQNDSLLYSTTILSAQDGRIAYLPYRTKQVVFHPLFGYPIKTVFGAKIESSPDLFPAHGDGGQY